VSDLLVVLNPRRMAEPMAAFQRLPIDRLYVRGMREFDVESNWIEIMERTSGYERLIVAGDDGIVRPHALEAVQRLLDAGHPVVTGYSNLSETDYRVNLTKSPLKGDAPSEDAYNLWDLPAVMTYHFEAVPTYFSGYTLLGMERELWERYPFRVFGGWPGFGSDFSISKRITDDKVPIVAAREAFVWHQKAVWNHTDATPGRELVMDKAEIVLEPAQVLV